MNGKFLFILTQHQKGMSAKDIAKQLGASFHMIERQISKLKGHDAWVLTTLASGNSERIKDLQEYFPKLLGCPVTMSLDVFEKLHQCEEDAHGVEGQ